MKKKIVSILLVMIMCVSVLAGCSLVTRNDKKYYEAVVATITYSDGAKENISKRELISAFNSYGYNYVQNYGYTQKQAMNQTLESLIEQRLTIKEVKDYYEEIGEDVLLASETTYLWDNTYETLLNNLKDYYRKSMNIADESTSSGSGTEDTSISVYSKFMPNAKVVSVTSVDEDGNEVTDYVIKKTTTASTTRATYEVKKDDNGNVFDYEFKNADGKEIFKEMMYEDIVARTEGTGLSARNWRNAFNKYIADVKANFSYKTFKDNKDCFMFEMDRIYNILKDNYLVQKYSEIYNRQNHQDSDTSNVTVYDVLKAYSARVRADYVNTSRFESNILNSIGSVDYVVEDGSANYFFVGYVKINLTDEQKKELDTVKSSGYLNETQKNAEIEKIYGGATAKVRNAKTGAETGETISAKNLLTKIQGAVGTAQYRDFEAEWQDMLDNNMTKSEEEYDDPADYQKAYEEFKAFIESYNKTIEYHKAESFRDYMYLYSDDDALKGADYNTVFGVKTDGTVLSSSFTDNDAVNDAIRDLYHDGKAKVGDMTDLVRVDDGYYVFFFAGKIENLFAVNNADFNIATNKENIKVLTSKRINIFSEKTLFDVLYDELATDNFTTFQNMNIRALRAKAKIKSYDKNLKDLY